MPVTYIPEEIAEQIKNTAVLKDVIGDIITLKPQGASFVGDCPCCSAKKKLTVTPGKKLWKCFVCDRGGSSATSFLMEAQGKTYPEALTILADRYNILVEEKTPVKKKKKSKSKIKFRDQQLRDSGIQNKHQTYFANRDNAKYEMDRYQSASVDKNWSVIPGDDMVLHYLDLNGEPLIYKNKTKSGALMRVRWANPALHPDKHNKAVKYKSPYQSGSHLWLPNALIKAYKAGQTIHTLYITEGEKKADKMCIEGMYAVGIMGIHNFALDGEMPYQFELLIKTCGIENVIFLLDSDWQNISIKDSKRVDQRPKTFFHAVLRFRNYFYAYVNEGIELNIYFAHGKDKVHKGIDDVLVYQLKGKESELKEDFKKTMISRDGIGQYINVHNITSTSEYKLKAFWHIQSAPKFIEHHKAELQKIKEFTLNGLKRRYNKESKEFELAQELLPHEEYWKKEYVGDDKRGNEKYKYSFSYTNILNFLKNRGYGLFHYDEDKFRFVKTEGKVLREVTPHQIQKFVISYTREISKPPVLELLLKGKSYYLGPDKLSSMFDVNVEFNKSEKDCQFLYFENCYWKITADKIIQRPLTELPKHVWVNKVINFKPNIYSESACQIERVGVDWDIKLGDEFKNSDIVTYYLNSSNFHWRKSQEKATDENGRTRWVAKEQVEKITKEEKKIYRANFVCKMIAAGYTLHDYKDYGNMRAIIGMDGVESEVGKSEGGTGKSLWAKQFEYLVPIEVIDGKKKNIEDDNHLYEKVDERTEVIVFDDVRVNFNFEFLFSQITTGVVVNPKGEKRYKILPPKFIIMTNHSLNGNGNSFDRRQYTISFSDYYNAHRKIGDDFGHQLFHEWEYDQWNSFYNFKANCIQLYLKYGLEYTIPTDVLEKRKLRQMIGENLLEWASLMYNTEDGLMLNKKVEKGFACEQYLQAFPEDKKYINQRKFKTKLKQYAEYAGLVFNPVEKGERSKSNGKEYFTLANDQFNAANYRTINNFGELSYNQQ